MTSENEREILLSRLTEETVGAFRFTVEKNIATGRGFPVGFSADYSRISMNSVFNLLLYCTFI